MNYCKKCVMPDIRPEFTFNEKGVCSACEAYEARKTVDFDKRQKEFKKLCKQYQGMNGLSGYDCMIAVSEGKDSHFQIYYMKEITVTNPLLVTVEDNFPITKWESIILKQKKGLKKSAN